MEYGVCMEQLTSKVRFCNPFVTNAPFFYPLKTSENLIVFLMFSGGRKGALGTNGLIEHLKILRHW